jgi:hypothetical protein
MSTRGRFVENWAVGLKEWWTWLLGDTPLPGKRSRTMLAATLFGVALLVVGLVIGFRGPGRNTSSDARFATPPSTTSMTAPATTTATSTPDDSAFVSGGTADTPTAVAGSGTASGTVSAKRTRAGKANRKSASAVVTPTTVAAVPSHPNGTAKPTRPDKVLHSLSAPIPTLVPVASTPRSGSAKVSWKPATSTTVTGYDVYVGTSPGAEYLDPANGSDPIKGRSFDVPNLVAGTTYYLTVRSVTAAGLSAASNEVSTTPVADYSPIGSLAGPVVGMASNPQGSGYWQVDAQGQVSVHGGVSNYGSVTAKLMAPVVGIKATPDGAGYWLVASDGGVFTFGDAPYLGSMGGKPTNAPIMGLAATNDGKGYWEVGADGGVFTFGDAPYLGSKGGDILNRPVIGIATDPATSGYWLVASDGGVFTFGAPFLGSAAAQSLGGPVVGMTSTADGTGYWLVSADGGVMSFGTAPFHGSAAGSAINAPVSGSTVDRITGGYWLVSQDGGIFAYGAPFYGAG